MSLIVQLVFFSSLVLTVNSAAPDCGIRNQFRGYCFSFDYCTNFACGSEKCGYFPRGSVLLKIQETRIIPQCAITNSTTITQITGINSNIHVLASGSFANLPNLESILLPYNQISELHHGIFYNVNVPLLDLSWNKIIYISEGAFNGITGLKFLNLSRNELSTFPVENMPTSITQINLSYNFLKRIALNGAKRPDLTSVDLSYNNLKNVALSFDNTLEKLDLTHNRLKNIDFYDINDCENLKIPSNLFTEVPQFLEYSRIKRVAIHPNPWKCDELKVLWSHLQNNNIEEEKLDDTDSQPLCALNTNVVSSRLKDENSLECQDDNHCSKNMLCRAHKCWNPCSSVCDSTNICEVENHQIECLCPESQRKNPREIYSPCYKVECFADTDCSPEHFCNYNRTCIQSPFGPVTPSATNFSLGNGGHSGSGYAGYAGHSGSGYGGHSGSGYGGNSYPGGYPTFGGSNNNNPGVHGITISSENRDGNEFSHRPVQPSEPWWFEEIPKFTPSNINTPEKEN